MTNYVEILNAISEPTLKDMVLTKQLIDKAVQTVNEKLNNLTEQSKHVEERIVAYLEDNDMTSVELDDANIKLSYSYFSGLSAKTREDLKVLYDTNNDGCIKKTAIIDLNEFPDVISQLQDLGVSCVEKNEVHHMTLSAVLKQLAESGELTAEQMETYKIYKKPKLTVKSTNV